MGWACGKYGSQRRCHEVSHRFYDTESLFTLDEVHVRPYVSAERYRARGLDNWPSGRHGCADDGYSQRDWHAGCPNVE